MMLFHDSEARRTDDPRVSRKQATSDENAVARARARFVNVLAARRISYLRTNRFTNLHLATSAHRARAISNRLTNPYLSAARAIFPRTNFDSTSAAVDLWIADYACVNDNWRKVSSEAEANEIRTGSVTSDSGDCALKLLFFPRTPETVGRDAENADRRHGSEPNVFSVNVM